MSKSNQESKDNYSIMNIKVAILGKSFVGKTALIYRFISDKIPTEYDPTDEDHYKVNMTI